MTNNSFLLIGGYISTGSTPLICLLKEYDNVEVLENELRVGEDGLFYLIGKLYKGEHVDKNKFNQIRSKTLDYSKSINPLVSNFLSLIVRVPGCPKGLAEAISRYRLKYRSYEKKFSGYFRIFNNLFEELSEVNRNLNVYSNDVRQKKLSTLFNKALISVKEKNITNRDKIMLVDQLMSPKVLFADAYAPSVLKLLPNAKVVIVKRDPRDQYIDFINKRKKAYHLMSHQSSTSLYIKEFKERYDRMNNLIGDQLSENVLFVWFEDIVKNYEKENQKISNFLGLKDHKCKLKYFYPGLAERYVEMYTTYKHQEDIAKIADEMHDHLYRKG